MFESFIFQIFRAIPDLKTGVAKLRGITAITLFIFTASKNGFRTDTFAQWTIKNGIFNASAKVTLNSFPAFVTRILVLHVS